MRQNLTKKLLTTILFLLALNINAQNIFVRFTDISVNSQPIDVNSQPIHFGLNQSVTLELQVEVYTTNPYYYNHSGSMTIFRSKTGSVNNAQTVVFSSMQLNNSNTYKKYTVTLNASDFNNSGGVLYAQFAPDMYNNYKSKLIPVLKLDFSPIANNSIGGQQTINEGDTASILTGSTPTGGYGAGTRTYVWQKKTASTSWQNISGATNKDYSPGKPIINTTYRRIVKSGDASNTSNEVVINVIQAPPLDNNNIVIQGGLVTGSIPTGGIGQYTYKWSVYFEEEEMDHMVLSLTTQSIEVPATIYNFANSIGTHIYRTVISGTRTSRSNFVLIKPSVEIQNNVIDINGTELIGSLPEGGNGTYSYVWYGYNLAEGEVIDTFQVDGYNQNNVIQIIPQMETKYYRVVRSADKISYSNHVSYNLPSLMTQSNILVAPLISNVYPNPTVGVVNFEIDVTSTTYTKIIVYNQSGKSSTIFKGNLTEGQVVKWNIPSDYPKGIYFYEISLENQEPKTGKIIYQ